RSATSVPPWAQARSRRLPNGARRTRRRRLPFSRSSNASSARGRSWPAIALRLPTLRRSQPSISCARRRSSGRRTRRTSAVGTAKFRRARAPRPEERAMEFKTVKLSIDGAVATLALNRPERLNALNATVHAEIREALSRVEANAAIRCLVVTGEGRAFCSGQDLTERVMTENTQIDTGASLDRDYNPLVRRLVAFPIPTIAAVNGPAVGAGANLALACDMLLFA